MAKSQIYSHFCLLRDFSKHVNMVLTVAAGFCCHMVIPSQEECGVFNSLTEHTPHVYNEHSKSSFILVLRITLHHFPLDPPSGVVPHYMC